MKTIAVIVAMMLCVIGSGYEVGDHVVILEQSLGFVLSDTIIGNITSIDDDFICIYMTEMVVDSDETSTILENPEEFCLAKNRIAGIRVLN